MSIQSEITRIANAKTAIANAITAKGGTVNGTIDTFASAINNLSTGSEGEGYDKSIIITICDESFKKAVSDFVGDGGSYIPMILCRKLRDIDTKNSIIELTMASSNPYNIVVSEIDVFDTALGFEAYIQSGFSNNIRIIIYKLNKSEDSNLIYDSGSAITTYIPDDTVGFIYAPNNSDFKAEKNNIYIARCFLLDI